MQAYSFSPKDYVRYKLTGELATDVSDASGMQLLILKTAVGLTRFWKTLRN